MTTKTKKYRIYSDEAPLCFSARHGRYGFRGTDFTAELEVGHPEALAGAHYVPVETTHAAARILLRDCKARGFASLSMRVVDPKATPPQTDDKVMETWTRGEDGVSRLTKTTHLPGSKLAVFSLKEGKGGTLWVRAGTAWVNSDGSLNVYLDVLPLDGKLHIRPAMEG